MKKKDIWTYIFFNYLCHKDCKKYKLKMFKTDPKDLR